MIDSRRRVNSAVGRDLVKAESPKDRYEGGREYSLANKEHLEIVKSGAEAITHWKSVRRSEWLQTPAGKQYADVKTRASQSTEAFLALQPDMLIFQELMDESTLLDLSGAG